MESLPCGADAKMMQDMLKPYTAKQFVVRLTGPNNQAPKFTRKAFLVPNAQLLDKNFATSTRTDTLKATRPSQLHSCIQVVSSNSTHQRPVNKATKMKYVSLADRLARCPSS